MSDASPLALSHFCYILEGRVPACVVLRFRDANGRVPFDDWVEALRISGVAGARSSEKIRFALERLAQAGHELRHPTAAPLRDGVYELRIAVGRVQYRVLYFFAGPGVAVVSHGCAKERHVPAGEIERAIRRRAALLAAPLRHTAPDIK
ncbi:MAG: type II toxin-antitoxin system RelE/ParE family toxin [Gemmatimonadaceae bacterium]|nr:type II toxin-antitoxin system RelE/ParE family toxin [Gemmatimonadaceae bacterium]